MPAFVALFVVYLAVRSYWWIGSLRTPLLDPVWIEQGLLKLILWVLPAFAMAMLATRRTTQEAWRSLGLAGSPARGYLFGAVAGFPMALVVLYQGSFSTSADLLAGTALLGPFAEEVLFRGFLFLTLRRLGWSLLPAMLVSALAFAVAHSQFAASVVAAGLFGGLDRVMPDVWRSALALLPFVGIGVVFAWITHRWQTIWPAVGLHAFINLWWEVSPGTLEYASVARSSVAPLPIAHAITVALAIALTLRATRARVRRVELEVPVPS